jgi:glycosyltransferase involved in cell wall biosynthesis
MKKILHVINDLDTGGAEMMLLKLLSHTNRELFAPTVISLLDGGVIRQKIEALGLPVYRLGGVNPSSLLRLRGLVRELEPDLVQGWMYYGNLAAQMSAAFLPRPAPVVWNIRHSLSRLRDEKFLTVATVWLGARLSAFPVRIVNNSLASTDQHERRMGYCAGKWEMIPNGFDTDLFVPSQSAREEVRSLLGLNPDTLLIGLIGRLHPQKDHGNFLHAAALLLRTNPAVSFLMAGPGVTGESQELMGLMEKLGISRRVHLLGERSDTPRIMAALDIATISSSFGEGFPNVIGEAMSCGVPCVATDVGDSARIIGPTGTVVPPRDAHALSDAWRRLVDGGEAWRRELGESARNRVIERYPLEMVVRRYEELYLRVLQPGFVAEGLE